MTKSSVILVLLSLIPAYGFATECEQVTRTISELSLENYISYINDTNSIQPRSSGHANQPVSLDPLPIPIEERVAAGHDGGKETVAIIINSLGFEEAKNLFKICDDMNLRGDRLWEAYVGYTKKDLPTLISSIRNRDPNMVEWVNDHTANYGTYDGQRVVISRSGQR